MKKVGFVKEIKGYLKTLYCNKKYAKTSIWMNIFYAFTLFLFNLSIYNSSELGGDLFTNEICFGTAVCVGIFMGDILYSKMSDVSALILSYAVIMIIAMILISGLSQQHFYLLYIIQILFVGATTPLMYNIANSRAHPKLAAISLELNYAIGSMFCSLSPVASKLSEPGPTYSVVLSCLICCFALY